MTAAGFTFVPTNTSGNQALVIPTRTAVTFANADIVSHTFTSNSAGLFNVTALPGQSATVTAIASLPAGEYLYHCDFHPWMNGVLVIS
ncbi:MAG: cupredoxin domain-containing protein [Actinomycetota bacterium]|nr:cupredoxin domain-containing protein [Actinomycetota bacterium]